MKVLRDNGLTIVLLIASFATIGGMMLTGLSVYNSELAQHGGLPIALGAYLATGHFLSALYENWESEFLQMSAYVMLTAFLFQRGSAESKDPDDRAPQDADPAHDSGSPDAPLPVRLGGFTRSLYSYSLGLTLFLLFVASFVMHVRDSAAAQAAVAMLHGQPAPTLTEYLFSAQLWFESFQNWQSEFLSTAVIVVLSIFLRFRGSPESKPVAAPHSETGA
jgi:membrane protein implicated in regulation of membrane protease activity